MNKNLKKIAALLLASGMIIGLLTTAPNAVSGRGEGWSVTQSASGSVKIAEDCFNGYVADISQYPSPTFTFGAEGSNAKAGSLRVVGTIYIPYYAAPVSKEVPDNIEPGASFELGDFTCSPDGFASMTPMGLVELNPSRENITMDNYTLNGLFKDCDTRYYAYQFEWDFDNVSQNDTKTCTVEIDNLSFTAGDDARIFSGDSSLAGSDNQGVLFLAKTELYSAGVVEQPADITPTIPPVDVDPVTSGGAIDAASDEQAQDSVVATIPPEDAAVTVFDVNNATADGTANAASLPAAAASDLVADNTADGGYSDYTASQSYMGIMYYVPSMSSASANINAAVSADTVGAVILMSSMLINDDIKSASEPEAVNSGETFSVNMVVSVSSALSGYNDTAVIRLKIQDESGNPSQFLEWVPQSASNISGYLKAGGISVVNGPNGLDYVDLPLNIDAMKIAGEAVKISVSFRFTNGVTPDGASVTIGGHMLVDNIEVDAQDSMSVQATSAAHSKWTVGQSVEKPLVTMPDLNAGDDAYIGMNKTDPLISNYFTFTATNKMITSPDNISLPNGYYQAGTLFTTSFKLTGQVLIPWYVCPEGVNFDPTGYVCDPNNADPRDPGSQFTRESFTYATGMDPDLVGGFTLLPNTMSVNIGSSANNNPYNMNTNGVAKWKDADMKYYVYQFTWTVNNGDFVYDGSANLWDYNDPATGATLATYDPATGTWSQMVDLSTISRTVTLQNYHFAAEPYSQLFNPDVPTFAGGYAAIFFASASGWNTEIEPAGAAQAWIPAPMDTNSSYNVKAVYYTQQSSNDNTIPNPNKIPFEKTAWPQSSIPGDNTTIQPYFILSGIDNIYDGSQSSGGVNYKIEPLSSLYFIDGFVDSHNVPAGLEASQNNVFSVLVPFSVDTGTYTIQPSGSASADTGLMAAYSTMRLNIYYTTASDPYSTTDWNLGYTFNPFNSNGTANTNQTVYFENAPGGAASMNLSAIRGNYSTLDMAVGAITGVKYDYVNTASSGLIPPGFKTADNSAACPKIFFQNPANDDLANFGRTPRGNGADGNPLPLIGTLPNSAQLHYTRNGSATEDTPVPANASIVYVQPGSLIVSDTKTADNATYPGQDGVKKLYYPGNTVAYTLYMQNVSGNGTTMPLNSLVIHDAPDKLLVSMDADASVNWTMQGAVSNISYQVWNSSNRIVIPATPITTWSYVNGELLFDLTGVDATQAVADGGTLVITYDLKLPEYADFNGYDPDTSFPVSLDNTFTANVTASDIPNNGKITIEVKGDVPLVSLTKDVVPNQTGQYYPGGTVDYAITASHLEGGFDNSMNQYGTNVVVLKDVFASNNFDLSYSSSPDGTPDILSSIQVKYYPADGSGAYTDATGAHYDLVSKDTAYSGAYSDYTGDGYLLYPVYPADGLQYPDASVSPADYYKYNDFSIALNRDTYFGVGDKIVVTFTAKIGNIGTGDGSVNFPAGQSTVDLKNNADLFLSPNKVTINYLLPSTGGTIDGGTVPIPGGGSIDYNWGLQDTAVIKVTNPGTVLNLSKVSTQVIPPEESGIPGMYLFHWKITLTNLSNVPVSMDTGSGQTSQYSFRDHLPWGQTFLTPSSAYPYSVSYQASGAASPATITTATNDDVSLFRKDYTDGMGADVVGFRMYGGPRAALNQGDSYIVEFWSQVSEDIFNQYDGASQTVTNSAAYLLNSYASASGDCTVTSDAPGTPSTVRFSKPDGETVYTGDSKWETGSYIMTQATVPYDRSKVTADITKRAVDVSAANQITAAKDSYSPSDFVFWRVTAYNMPTSLAKLVPGFKIIDVLPDTLSYDASYPPLLFAGAASVGTGTSLGIPLTGADAPTISADGKTLTWTITKELLTQLNAAWADGLPTNQSVSVLFRTQASQANYYGPITNPAYLVTNNQAIQENGIVYGRYIPAGSADGESQQLYGLSQEGIRSQDVISVYGFTGISSYKTVTNDNNPSDTVSSYTAGGLLGNEGYISVKPGINGDPFTYTLNVQTTNQSATFDNIVVIDTLPRIGDTGVVATGQNRGSQWQPYMPNPKTELFTVTLGGNDISDHVTVEYSAKASAALGGTYSADWYPQQSGDDDTVWIPQASWNSAEQPLSVRFIVDSGYVIKQNVALKIAYTMYAPADSTITSVYPGLAPANQIAWNSFGFAVDPANVTNSSGSPVNMQRMRAEPVRVGVKTDFVNVEFNKVYQDSSDVPSGDPYKDVVFTLTQVTQTGGGSGGVTVAPVTGGAVYVIGGSNIPADQKDFTLDSNGHFAGTILPGQYMVTETSPSGYQLVGFVAANGSTPIQQSVNGHPGAIYVDLTSYANSSGAIVFTATNARPRTYGFDFQKVDENANGLAGATFTLYSDPACTLAVGTAVSGANGAVSFSGLASDGTYYMKETGTPANYQPNAMVYRVVINTDGSFVLYKLDSSVPGGYSPIDPAIIVNTPVGFSYQFQKIGAGADINGLAGATFALYNNDRCAPEDVIAYAASDNSGIVRFTNLTARTYYMKETVAPAGYEQNDTLYRIIIDSAGVGTLSWYDAVSGAYVAIPTNVIIDTPVQQNYSYQFTKVDENGGNLAGATFALYNNERCAAADLIAYAVSDGSGIVRFTNLTPGTYFMKETTPPAGYAQNDALYRIIIDSSGNGTLSMFDTASGQYVPIDPVIANTPSGQLYGFQFRKIGEGDDINGLAGATFALYNNERCAPQDVVAYAASDSNGNVQFTGLTARTYYMKETAAPAGYAPNTTLYRVVIDASGNATLSWYDQTSDTYRDMASLVIANYKQRPGFWFNKVNEAGGPLAGAVFTLYNDERCRTTDIVANATSGPDGIVSFAGLPAGTYYMKETTAPAGYALSGVRYKVVLNADGTFIMYYFDMNTNSYVQMNSATLANTQNRYGFSFVKVDAFNRPLAGAQFSLYSDSALQNLVATAVSVTGTGRVTFANLLPGTYYMVESRAPAGYTLLTTVYRVTISANGTFSIVDSAGAPVSVIVNITTPPSSPPPSNSPTPSPSNSPTPPPSHTPTPSHTPSPSHTPTIPPTPSHTPPPSNTPTVPPTPSNTPTIPPTTSTPTPTVPPPTPTQTQAVPPVTQSPVPTPLPSEEIIPTDTQPLADGEPWPTTQPTVIPPGPTNPDNNPTTHDPMGNLMGAWIALGSGLVIVVGAAFARSRMKKSMRRR